MDTKEDKKRSRDNAKLAGTSADTVRRYGTAVKEHAVSYSGKDNDTGLELERSLKKVSLYRRGNPETDPNYARVTKNQAGFSAEIKEAARQRAEQAIRSRRPYTRRTDDIPGHVNDQLFDLSKAVDKNGNPVPGASCQMKFVGSTPEAAVDKMLSGGYEKYLKNDVKMMVPKDYFPGMHKALDHKIASLEGQIKSLQEQGKNEAILAKYNQLDKCRILKKNLLRSQVSNSEALEARNHPMLSTGKDIARVAHRAGTHQAMIGAGIGSGTSLIRNLIAVYKKEKTADQAALSIGGDTANAAAVSYASAFSGAVLKGMAQNSGSQFVRVLSKTNLPAYVAVSVLELSKTMKAFFSGKITGVQCVEGLGEKGYGMVNGAMYAMIGQAVIPIPIMGALIGSMVGYTLSTASYNALLGSLHEEKLVREARIRIKRERNESFQMMKQYREELQRNIRMDLSQKQQFFNQIFIEISNAMRIGDVEKYITSMNLLTRYCGGKVLFASAAECDALMLSDTPIGF
ncbi:MAG: hypothetical protein WCT05_04800 [Lentisphaeria bacterium]